LQALDKPSCKPASSWRDSNTTLRRSEIQQAAPKGGHFATELQACTHKSDQVLQSSISLSSLRLPSTTSYKRKSPNLTTQADKLRRPIFLALMENSGNRVAFEHNLFTSSRGHSSHQAQITQIQDYCKPACPKLHPSTYYNVSPSLFTTDSGIIAPAVYFLFQFLSQQNLLAHTRRFARLAPILRHRRSELLVWIHSQILVTVLDTFPILSNILVEILERPIVNGDLNLTQGTCTF